jgi:hypothetical protein
MPNLSESYNLYALRPDLAKEWHPTRNGSLGPKDVTPGSRKKVWWLCEKGHWWLAPVRCRTRGMRCSFCLSLQKHGDQRMVDAKLELLKEWHPSRNMDLKANEVSVNQREKIWWICEQGHEWHATIRSRLRGKSCPVCCKDGPPLRSIEGQRMMPTSRKASDHPPFSTPPDLADFKDGLSPLHAGAELRKSIRYTRLETVMVEKSQSDILAYAQLKNFSAEGMMLFSDVAMRPGEFIKVRFDKPLHTSIPKIVTSRVVWCRDLEEHETAGSRFGIGLRLM